MEERLTLQGVMGPVFSRVLRAAGTVLAGEIGFTYDQVVQIRVAISESYDLIHRNLSQEELKLAEVGARFELHDDRIEIILTGPLQTPAPAADAPPNVEGIEVLRSIVDEMSITSGNGSTTVRFTKYKSPEESAP